MYDKLYDVWIKEKKNVQVQKLPKDFYMGTINYIGRIRQEGRMLDLKSLKAKLISREFDNAKKLLEELIRLRFEKCIQQITLEKTLGKAQLTEEEQAMLLGASNSSESFNSFLKEASRGKVSKVEKTEQRNRTVLRFLKETPAIAGNDLRVYGPFSVEDVATLPIENAKVLVKHKVAVEVEV